MIKARYRKPVRDPVAGILSDWFGIENGSAKMLNILYEAQAPLSIRTIARRAGLSLSSVTLCSGRLRKAGIDLPSQRGRRSPSYELSHHGRHQVREAFAHTLRLLGAEVPDVTRIEDLERELGAPEAQHRFGLTRMQEWLFSLMEKNAILTRTRAYTVLWGDRADPPSTKLLDVMVTHIRKKIAPHGYEVRTVFGIGWELIRREEREAA